MLTYLFTNPLFPIACEHIDMQPVKIIFCIDKLIRGGTELQLIGLINQLDREKFTPYLLTIRESAPDLTPANCIHLNWHVKKLFSLSGIRSLVKLVRYLRDEKIDVVQTFFQDSTLFGGTAAFLANTKVRIACFRDLGFWHSKKQAVLLKWVYGKMTGFICNAEIVKSHFSNSFSLPREKMVLLRNGIDVAALPYVEHTGPIQNIGIVGNMTRHVKRTDLFIRAAAIVHKSYPSIRFHIIGDGHMRPELEAMAKELGVFNQLHFAGRVADVTGYLGSLDLGVICSDSEGLSNALLEYMFRGVTAVATSVGGNPELVEDGVTGLLVPPNNEEALAQAMANLIENPLLARQLAAAARQKVESEYSWEKCIAAHNHFYQEQLARP